MSYKVIDLFAGVGGLSYGFSGDPSFEVVAANELLEPMARAYRLNHPGTLVYNSDVRDFSYGLVKSDLGLSDGDVDVLVGGPPCQAYSTAGMRRDGDPRAVLFREYFRLLKEIRPKVFLFENVKGLLSMQGGGLFRTILSLFESAGYRVSVKVLNAADFGAPQIRERVVVVGTLASRDFVYPEPTHGAPSVDGKPKGSLKPWVTFGEATGDLPSMESGRAETAYACGPQNDYQRLMRKNASDVLSEHITRQCNDRMIALMKVLPEGGTPKDVPEEFRPRSGFANSYSRLWWNRPSTTVTRNFGCPSSARCIHPRDPRPLSTREGARLQGFPDDYVFCGTESQKHL